jgi:hypothetical protein
MLQGLSLVLSELTAGLAPREASLERGGRDVTEMMPGADTQDNAACPITIVASGSNTFASAVMTNLAGKAGKVLP